MKKDIGTRRRETAEQVGFLFAVNNRNDLLGMVRNTDPKIPIAEMLVHLGRINRFNRLVILELFRMLAKDTAQELSFVPGKESQMFRYRDGSIRISMANLNQPESIEYLIRELQIAGLLSGIDEPTEVPLIEVLHRQGIDAMSDPINEESVLFFMSVIDLFNTMFERVQLMLFTKLARQGLLSLPDFDYDVRERKNTQLALYSFTYALDILLKKVI